MFRAKPKSDKANLLKRVVLAILPGLVVFGLVLSANYYYDLDTTTVKLQEKKEISVSSSGSALIVTQSGAGYAAIFTGGYVGIGTTTPATTLTVYGTSTFMGGNVGIGTTTPAYLLDVYGTSRLGSATSTQAIFRGYVQSDIIPYQDATYNLGSSNFRWGNIYAATATIGSTLTINSNTISGNATTTINTTAGPLILNPSGYVGIGTTTPAYTLDVYGNARLGTSTASSLFFRGLANFNNNFYISTSGNVATGTWQGTPIGVSFGGTGTSTNFTTGSVIFASASGIYSQNNANLFWDNTNLRLGIGTTTPATTLQVYGTSTFMGGYVGIGDTSPTALLTVGSGDLFQVTSSGYVRGPAGASSTPTFSFTGDTDTGIYGPGSDILRLVTAGTDRLTINASGYVGIGTSTPATTLGVYGTSTFMGGYVGIGTTNPQVLLHIGNASSTQITSPSRSVMISGELEVAESAYLGPMKFAADSGVVSWIDMLVSTSTATGTVESYTARLGGTDILTIYGQAAGVAGGITNPYVGIGTTTPASTLQVYGTSTFMGGYVGIATTSPAYTLDVNGTLRAIATSTFSGRVGIGTTTPATALQVYGRIRMNEFQLGTSATSGYVLTADSSGVGAWLAAASGVSGSGSANRAAFWSATSTVSYDDNFSWDNSNKRLGIGTSSASSLLELYSTADTGTKLTVTAASSTDPQIVFRTGSTPATKFVLGVDYSESNKFKIATSTIGTDDVLTINQSGYVGIGTTTPNEMLTVWGGMAIGTSTIPTLYVASSTGRVGIGTTTPNNLLEVKDLISFSNADWKTLIGYQSGRYDLGQYNTYLGYQAGYSNSASSTNEADYNTAVGYRALFSNATGSYNSAMGDSALQSNTSGSSNSAMGRSALYYNTSGSYNSAMGDSALQSNTSGSSNSAMGSYALFSNATGSSNSAMGDSALRSNTTGYYNSAMGESALRSNTTGYYNSAMGMNALYYNTSATSATAIGFGAARGTANYSNQYGVYLGAEAGFSASTGSNNNTMIGFQSGYSVNTGANNVLLGYQAGYNITSGSNNILIGYDIDAQSATGNNQMSIGNLIFGTNVDGTGTTISSGNVGIGTTTPSSLFEIYSSTDNTKLTITSATTADPQIVFRTGTTTTTRFVLGVDYSDSNKFKIATSTIGTDDVFVINQNGYVGIGTSSPQVRLHIGTASSTQITSPSKSLMVSGELEVVESAYLGPMEFPADSGVVSWIDMSVSTSTATSTVESYAARLGGTDILTIYGEAAGIAGGVTNPRVSIGTSTPPTYAKLTICYTSACALPAAASTTLVLGSIDDATSTASIRAKGTITASLADIGEYVRIEGEAGDYEPGDILEASTAPGVFRKSSQSYSPTLVGPVTNASAFIAGSGNATWKDGEVTDAVILSLSGQVQVKVSTENGLIQVGDPLTSANQPGVAMKATAPGRVIGMALESFDQASPGASSTTGKILAFINSHWYAGKLAVDGSVSTSTEGTTTEGTSIVQESSNFDGFIQKVKAGLAVLGLFIENGVAQIRELVTDKLFAKKARIEKLEMVDKATGEIYCTWIENGEWQKVKGECDATNNEQPSEQPSEQPPAEETPTEQPPAEELPTSTEPSPTPPVEAPAPVEQPAAPPVEAPIAEPGPSEPAAVMP